MAPTETRLKEEMRARTERLLRGHGRPEDISTLFVFLRHRSRGRATVAEIGDFFAHREEKNKGAVTDELRDFFTVARVKPSLGMVTYDASNLPLNYGKVLWAAFRLLDSETIKRDTELKRQRVEKMLPGIVSALVPNGKGSLRITALDSDQIRVFNCLSRYLIVRPAFSEERLIGEFIDALCDARVLASEERRAMRALGNLISLTAISGMHLTQIEFEDSDHANLTIYREEKHAPHLCVHADAQILNPLDQTMAYAIYQTSLVPEDYCEPELLADNGVWNYPIELKPNWKLGRF